MAITALAVGLFIFAAYFFKAVFDNGQSLIRNNINVCRIETYTYDD